MKTKKILATLIAVFIVLSSPLQSLAASGELSESEVQSLVTALKKLHEKDTIADIIYQGLSPEVSTAYYYNNFPLDSAKIASNIRAYVASPGCTNAELLWLRACAAVGSIILGTGLLPHGYSYANFFAAAFDGAIKQKTGNEPGQIPHVEDGGKDLKILSLTEFKNDSEPLRNALVDVYSTANKNAMISTVEQYITKYSPSGTYLTLLRMKYVSLTSYTYPIYFYSKDPIKCNINESGYVYNALQTAATRNGPSVDIGLFPSHLAIPYYTAAFYSEGLGETRRIWVSINSNSVNSMYQCLYDNYYIYNDTSFPTYTYNQTTIINNIVNNYYSEPEPSSSPDPTSSIPPVSSEAPIWPTFPPTDTPEGDGGGFGFFDILKGIGDFFNGLGGFFDGLLTGIGNLLNGLVNGIGNMLSNLLKSLFIPREDFFTEKYENIKAELETKLPYEDYIAVVDNLKTIENPDADKGFPNFEFTVLGVACVLPLGDIINPHIPMISNLAVAMTLLILAYFHYRQIMFLLRGATYSGINAGVSIASGDPDRL